MALDTKRHDLLFDKATCTHPVHIIGIGGIGSNVARQLSKLGVGEHGEVHVWDDDIVEPHNVSSQAYRLDDVGHPKTEQLREHYRSWNGTDIIIHHERVTQKIPLAGIVFLCVDNNDIRKEICETSIWHNPDVLLLIEARMDAVNVLVHTLNPNSSHDIECWNLFWFPHAEAENLAGCGSPLSAVNTTEITAGICTTQFMAWHREGFGDLPHQIQLDLVNWELLARVW